MSIASIDPSCRLRVRPELIRGVRSYSRAYTLTIGDQHSLCARMEPFLDGALCRSWLGEQCKWSCHLETYRHTDLRTLGDIAAVFAWQSSSKQSPACCVVRHGKLRRTRSHSLRGTLGQHEQSLKRPCRSANRPGTPYGRRKSVSTAALRGTVSTHGSCPGCGVLTSFRGLAQRRCQECRRMLRSPSERVDAERGGGLDREGKMVNICHPLSFVIPAA